MCGCCLLRRRSIIADHFLGDDTSGSLEDTVFTFEGLQLRAELLVLVGETSHLGLKLIYFLLPKVQELPVTLRFSHCLSFFFGFSGFSFLGFSYSFLFGFFELVLETLDVQLELLLNLDVIPHLSLILLEHHLVVLRWLIHGYE